MAPICILALCASLAGCTDKGGGNSDVPSDRQETCELYCEQMQECLPGEVTDEAVVACKEQCDPEVYIEQCEAQCASDFDDGSPELEACNDECVYAMYETGEEYCQLWCTEGGGDCGYCDDIFNDACQGAYLDYEICELALDCDELDDDDRCPDEYDAVVEACDNF